jgi:transporter family protein
VAPWVLESTMVLVLWGLWAFFPKLAVRYISPGSSLVFEAVGVFIVAAPLAAVLGRDLQVDPRGVVPALLTGVCGAAGLYFFFAVARQVAISIVAPFTALYPVVNVLLASLFLGERLHAHQVLGVVLAVVAGCLLAWESS